MDLKNIINATITTDWKDILLKYDTTELDKSLHHDRVIFKDLIDIYPPENLIFNAFNQFDFADTKIVLIGQDCYINKGEAMGLCFSVPDNITIPPSLRNIYKEIHTDLGLDTSARNGDLTHWARQGILLINSALTVREGKSNSHQHIWTPYTDQIIQYISDNSEKIIFILWGNNAKSKKKFIDSNKHFIIEGTHPSPLSAIRGFFGCKHFSKCNKILESIGKNPINW